MTAQDTSAAPVSVKMGLLITLALVVVGGAWLALGGLVLHLKSFFASFLLVWFWATVEKMEHRRLPSAVVGALAGLAVAWVYRYAAATYGTTGTIAALVLILVLIFVQIMNWAPFVVNASLMLFLTVGCIPALLASADFIEVGATVVAGAVFFGAVIWLAQKVGSKMAAPAAPAAPKTA